MHSYLAYYRAQTKTVFLLAKSLGIFQLPGFPVHKHKRAIRRYGKLLTTVQPLTLVSCCMQHVLLLRKVCQVVPTTVYITKH